MESLSSLSYQDWQVTSERRNGDTRADGFPCLVSCVQVFNIFESPLDFFFLITSISSFHKKLSSEVTDVSNWMDRVENHMLQPLCWLWAILI